MLWILACRAPLPPATIVVVMDGVRSEELGAGVSDLDGVSAEARQADLLAALGPNAVIVPEVIQPGITATGPAHAAMLTGRLESLANVPPIDGYGSYRPEVPTLFEAVRGQLDLGAEQAVLLANTDLADMASGSVAPTGGERLAATLDTVADADTTDARILDTLRARITADHPRLVVVNLHRADLAGHLGDADGYLGHLEDQAAGIAALWRWLGEEEPEYRDRLLLAVVADHGRHLEEDWEDHGDQCRGCRTVPLVLAGAGVLPVSPPAVVTPLDLAPTLAGWLGVSLPYADGLPLSGLVPTDARPRAGLAQRVSSGEVTVEVVLHSDPARRSSVEAELAGVRTVLSSEGALLAEAPAVLAGSTGTYACFRELVLTGEDELPWRPRCLSHTAASGWTEMPSPVDVVGSTWEIALVEHEGALLAAWSDNPDGVRLSHDGRGVYVHRSVYTGVWTTLGSSEAWFPTGISAAGELAAWAGHDLGEDGGGQARRVFVGEPGVTLTRLEVPSLPTDQRLERPVLRADGGALAMLAFDGDRWRVAVAERTDAGWGAPVVLDGAEALPQIAPMWSGEVVQWIGWDGGAVRCAAPRSDEDSGEVWSPAECVPLRLDAVRAAGLDGVIGLVDSVWSWTPG